MESRVLRVADDTPSVWLPSSSKLVSRSSLAKRSELPTHTCSNPVGEPASSVSHLSSQQRQPLFLINHFQLQVTLWLFFPSLSLCCDERCSQGGSQATKVCLEVSMALLWMYLKFLHMITCYFKRFHAPCGYVECRFFLKKEFCCICKGGLWCMLSSYSVLFLGLTFNVIPLISALQPCWGPEHLPPLSISWASGLCLEGTILTHLFDALSPLLSLELSAPQSGSL